MWEKSLAEAIILQSMEDLWNSDYRKESVEVFRGDGFRICDEIADLNINKQFRIIHLMGG